MRYRAQVTLQGDPYGIHAAPSAWLAGKLIGLDATIQFHRGEDVANIQPNRAMIDILESAITLKLISGTTFEISCGGPQALDAFNALREGFTTDCFKGSEFISLDSQSEASDA